uniref:Uncharacterized protein n=1 Tax=Nelumbo nucifera TaxID=4432 RepID=A0A822YWY9_NELNU|nr:TPA_asm: hypothetical protein HUJ06_006691 [Nelumbo nucifera]
MLSGLLLCKFWYEIMDVGRVIRTDDVSSIESVLLRFTQPRRNIP